MSNSCPTCGATVSDQFEGFNTNPSKQRLFEELARSGRRGMTTADIMKIVYPGRPPDSSLLIKTHISQMRQTLAQYGVTITSTLGPGARYVMSRKVHPLLEILIKERIRQKISWIDVAEQLQVSLQTLSSWEQGVRDPSIFMLQCYADRVGYKLKLEVK